MKSRKENIMNVRSKLVAIAGSALILASSITMGAAEPVDPTKTNASVSITKGDGNIISVSITSGDFLPVNYSFEGKDTTGTLEVTVTDLRGTAAGWKVNLGASDFTTGGTSAKTFEIDNLSITPGAPVETTMVSNGTTVTPSGAIEMGPNPQLILTAEEGHGDGIFVSELAGVLAVPGGTLVGTYTAPVTVSLEAAP